MINPIFALLLSILHLYEYVLIGWIILSWLIALNIVNRYQPIVQRLSKLLAQLTEPLLRPIRNLLPDLGGFDISPILLILLLRFVENSIYYVSFHDYRGL